MRQPTASRYRRVLGARELLLNLTVRELKVRYKRSVLGFMWSLLSPLLMMGVFYIVFTKAFDSGVENFHLFFLAGYLPWAFFQASTLVSTGIVVANSGLITKVAFPREVLPLSVVGAQLVHFGLALLVLFAALIFWGYNFLPYLWLLVLAIVLLTVFTTGVAMFFAATNTILRDIGEFMNVFFLLWFYLTPVVYPPELLRSYQWIIDINPMAHYVALFRGALYDLRVPPWEEFAAAGATSVAALLIGWTVYARLSARFAKEV